jgi:hypothetical protein
MMAENLDEATLVQAIEYTVAMCETVCDMRGTREWLFDIAPMQLNQDIFASDDDYVPGEQASDDHDDDDDDDDKPGEQQQDWEESESEPPSSSSDSHCSGSGLGSFDSSGRREPRSHRPAAPAAAAASGWQPQEPQEPQAPQEPQPQGGSISGSVTPQEEFNCSDGEDPPTPPPPPPPNFLIKFVCVLQRCLPVLEKLGEDGQLTRMAATHIFEQLRCGVLPELSPVFTSQVAGRRSPHVALCSHASQCDWKVKAALPLQLLMLLPSRGFACIFMVTFGKDCEITAWIHSELRWALDLGLLRLASGGSVGESHLDSQDREVLDHLPRMDFWHASKAKNTSHMFAILSHELFNKGQLGDLILVCLDADNICHPDYVPELVQTMASCKEKALKALSVPNKDMGDRSQVLGLAARCASGVAALTGRVAMFATDFLNVGGYDQEDGIAPSGYQDVDLQLRVCEASKEQNGWNPKALTVKGGGCAFPNTDTGGNGFVGMSAQQKKVDRSQAKVEYCEAMYKQMGWHKCNDLNMAAMKAKTSKRLLVRNIADLRILEKGRAIKYQDKLLLCQKALGAFVCWHRRPVTDIPGSTGACSSNQANWEAGAPEPTGAHWPPRRMHVPNSRGTPLQSGNVHILIMTAGQPANLLQGGLAQRLCVMHSKFLFQAQIISAREAWIFVRKTGRSCATSQ